MRRVVRHRRRKQRIADDYLSSVADRFEKTPAVDAEPDGRGAGVATFRRPVVATPNTPPKEVA